MDKIHRTMDTHVMLYHKRELIAYQLDEQEAPNLSNNSEYLNC